MVVGDRLLTDVAQGHNLGGIGVWVKPWDLSEEQRSIKISRTYEEFIWRFFMGWSTAKYMGKDLSGLSKNNPFKDD